MHLDVADNFEDGFEDGGVAPGAGRLGIDNDQQAFGGDGRDHPAGFLERAVEAGGCVGRVGGGSEGELFVALADVGLVVDAMQNPLAQVAFEMQQQVGDGVS